MKLSPRDASRFFKSPDTTRAGLLLHGPDTMRIALRRKELVSALIGPDGVQDMRLDRFSGADLRSDPARLLDALQARGFFPGQRAVLVEDATDGLAKPMAAALDAWKEGDAFLLVTAGQLTARSALRKLFEAAPNALSLGIYADPPSREEVEAAIQSAGLTNVNGEAMRALTALSNVLDPGDFAQTLEKIALYTLSSTGPVTIEDVEQMSPSTSDAAIDDTIAALADGNVAHIGPQMARLSAQGTNPTTLCIAATRHFRQLHIAAASGNRPEEALGRLRPPVFGPRQSRMAAQIRGWGQAGLERVLSVLMDTDLTLRSSTNAPSMAVLERAFIRIAMMRRT